VITNKNGHAYPNSRTVANSIQCSPTKNYAKGSSMNLMNNPQNQFMGTVLGPAQAAAK
jgi:hypothetical protein|tara:strand:- start:1387 stop:1560 length:174 start_codon:yes stop_codon:yes gene_type:complete